MILPTSTPTSPRTEGTTIANSVSKIALYCGMVLAGLFAGFLVAVLVIEATLRGFDASVYTQVRKVELVRLDDLATVLLPAAIVATVIVLVMAFRSRDRTRWLIVTALALLVAVFAISALVSVPINTAQLNWSVPAPPADWANVRDRWQIAHLVRTAAAVLAFGSLTAAAIIGTLPARVKGGE